jgi:hypothetical protein
MSEVHENKFEVNIVNSYSYNLVSDELDAYRLGSYV